MLYKLIVAVMLVGTQAFQAPVAARSSNFAAVSTVEVARTADVQMGATIRELRDRVGSVKNTKKITGAMKLVAAAKVRRAQEAVLRSRPFSETLERILGGLLQRLSTESLDIPLLESRTVDKVGAHQLSLEIIAVRLRIAPLVMRATRMLARRLYAAAVALPCGGWARLRSHPRGAAASARRVARLDSCCIAVS